MCQCGVKVCPSIASVCVKLASRCINILYTLSISICASSVRHAQQFWLKGVLTQCSMELVNLYLSHVGLGRMSCETLGQFCAAQPEPRLPVFDELAKCVGGNAERNLHRWCAKQSWMAPLPELYRFPMKKTGASAQDDPVDTEHACLLPHEVFASLAAASPFLFHHLMGTPERLLDFWRNEKRAAEAHPATCGEWFNKAQVLLGASAQWGCVSPIGIHGDDAGMQGEETVTILTWGCVAVDLPTFDSRICFSMLKHNECVPGLSLDMLFEVLVWSLGALAQGKHPSRDHTGKAFGPNHHPNRHKLAGLPLSTERRLGLWCEMRGDWKFLKESLHLDRHYGTTQCCHLCSASKKGGNLSYHDFSRDGPCRQTLTTTAEFGASAQEKPTPLLKLPAFSIHRVFFDIMHTLDLGVLQSAVPCALKELTAHRGVFIGSDVSARVREASALYRAWCKAERVRASARKLTMHWVKSKNPRVSQVHIKAAAMRRMVKWMAKICNEALSVDGSLHAKRRAAMFALLWRADCVMREEGRHLGGASAQKIQDCVLRALELYKALSLNAPEEDGMGFAGWALKPKHHALMHIVLDNGGTNPRMVHCYSDEDMVGKLKAIYMMCHARTAPTRAMQRYMILQGIRWQRLLRNCRAPVYRVA